jgi:hypothetical protein
MIDYLIEHDVLEYDLYTVSEMLESGDWGTYTKCTQSKGVNLRKFKSIESALRWLHKHNKNDSYRVKINM